MAITIIKKLKSLKSKTAIKNPHHFTVKVSRERKVELKMLAVRRRETVMAMFAAALKDFMAAHPTDLAHVPATQPTDRFVFKVEPDVAAAVHALVEALEVPAQTIITAALDAYAAKHAAE